MATILWTDKSWDFLTCGNRESTLALFATQCFCASQIEFVLKALGWVRLWKLDPTLVLSRAIRALKSAASFALELSQCGMFILDSFLCLSLCQWQLQSACEVNYKQDSFWALTEFKGGKPSVLFCWSGTETKLLALGSWKGEKKSLFILCNQP